jgi:hypothetical protein
MIFIGRISFEAQDIYQMERGIMILVNPLDEFYNCRPLSEQKINPLRNEGVISKQSITTKNLRFVK